MHQRIRTMMVDKSFEMKWFYCDVPCAVVVGGWSYCGYVGVDSSHPWYRKTYVDLYGVSDDEITFADKREGSDLWWVGIDFGHCHHIDSGLDWDLNHAKTQVEILAVAAYRAFRAE